MMDDIDKLLKDILNDAKPPEIKNNVDDFSTARNHLTIEDKEYLDKMYQAIRKGEKGVIMMYDNTDPVAIQYMYVNMSKKEVVKMLASIATFIMENIKDDDDK